ncbi:MAG TPA: peptide-methionine (R)-S-oxide reductase MsrB [Candidatus Paceibacterota bacterium]
MTDMTEDEWKGKLTPEQYKVMRKKGTERAFSGRYHDYHGKGMFTCAGCGAQLFSADTKFDSGTGWPSFDQALPGAVTEVPDNSFFSRRTEVVCAKCGGHFGHVFDDYHKTGPSSRKATTSEPKRFCINSCALDLEGKKD